MPRGSLPAGLPVVTKAGDTSNHCRRTSGYCRDLPLGARSPNWALINPVPWLRSPARLPITTSLCGRGSWVSPPSGPRCEGMLGRASTPLVQDPARQFHNCFLKGPGGLSKSVELQSNRGGSLGGFILIDFVRSCCILLHLKTRLWNNFERLTRTQKAAF